MTTETKPFDIDALPYYVVEKTEHRRILEGRYWNANWLQTAIVASVTYFKDANRGDWSAYIGSRPSSAPPNEREMCKIAAEEGAKLPEKDARYFFPAIKLPYRA